MKSKAFCIPADLADKKNHLRATQPALLAYTAEGDPTRA